MLRTKSTTTNIGLLDGRYLKLDQSSAQTVSLGAPYFSSGVRTTKLYPNADSTTAIQINKADGTTNVLNVDTTNVGVGIGAVSTTEERLYIARTSTVTSGNSNATRSSITASPATNSSASYRGLFTYAEGTGSADITGNIAGVFGQAVYSGSGTISNLLGLTYSCTLTSGAATQINAIDVSVLHNSAGTTATARGLMIAGITKSAGTITTAVGVDIASITSGGTNFAIRSNAGTVDFGDTTRVRNPSSAALGVGGTLELYGNYTGTSSTIGSKWKTAKSNGTGGNWDFDLVGFTRLNGSGDVTERIRIGAATGIAITPVANVVQLSVKANATQTANLQEWQNSSGTALTSVSSNGMLGINMTPGTTTPLDVKSTASFATLSATLLTNGDFGTGDFTGWSAGAGWSVVSYAAVCASGSGTALSQNVSVSNGSWYVLYFDYNRVSGYGNLTITLGSQTYYVNPTNATNRSITMSANTTGTVALSITPPTTMGDTTFDNIRLYRVTAVSNPNQRYYNSSGSLTMEFRDGGNQGNAGFGQNDLSYLVPSIDGTQGTDNLAFGTNSLENTTTGDRNISVGTQCMRRLTHGSSNTAIGYGAAIFGYGFSDCVVIGNQAMRNQLIGGGNVAIGSGAMFTNQYSGLNVAIGYQALYTMNHTIATANGYNTAVGTWSMQNATTGTVNTGIGAFALQAVGTGSSNVAVGYGAGQTVAKSTCVLLGREAGYQIGNSSICIGYQAGYYETGASRLYIHNSSSTTPLIYGLFSGTGAGLLIRSQATDGTPLVVRGIASQTSYILEIQDSTNAVHNKFHVAHASNVYENVLNELGSPNLDFRVESDNYDSLFVDASNDSIAVMNNASGKTSFYGATPIVKPSAYTQTYSTADKTHANFTSADIGAFTGGTVGFLDAAERDNIRTQFNALRTDVADVKQLVNSLIDDLQSLGLVG
jgi:hypothetical protein